VRKIVRVSVPVISFLAIGIGTSSKEKRPNPALQLLTAARIADARASGENFGIQATIKLEQGNGKKSDGHYILAWASPTQWREEFSFPDFHQVRVGAPGGVWQERDPSFLSLRIWQLMQALNFYGRFTLPIEESASKIKRKKKSGSELRCVQIARHSYPMSEFCFQGTSAQLVSEHYLPSDRWYEFSDFKTIRAKVFPGHILVLDGKTLAAEFSVSSIEETDGYPAGAFSKPARSEWLPWCASPDAGGDPLTPIYSRFVDQNRESTLYGVLGTDGQWHDVHVLQSGGATHDAKVLDALRRERWRPASCNGVPIQAETVFPR
jgi:hypothetical protein